MYFLPLVIGPTMTASMKFERKKRKKKKGI